ncbi:MAG: hypothetical protein M3552_08855 [Planctomycetota bacterium]|nr:hypothetical protein [Planctomycetota bacterium]
MRRTTTTPPHSWKAIRNVRPQSRTQVTLVIPLLCSLIAADETPSKGDEQVTLMGMLLEWRYPARSSTAPNRVTPL